MVFLNTKKNHHFLLSSRRHHTKEMENTIRKHKHVIVRAYVSNPPRCEANLSEWCKDVISKVGMKVLGGPLVVASDMVGNAGLTAVAVLDFSHLAIHSWDEISPALIEFDLFSCKDFNITIVLDKLREFGLVSYTTVVIDRDELENTVQKAA